MITSKLVKSLTELVPIPLLIFFRIRKKWYKLCRRWIAACIMTSPLAEVAPTMIMVISTRLNAAVGNCPFIF